MVLRSLGNFTRLAVLPRTKLQVRMPLRLTATSRPPASSNKGKDRLVEKPVEHPISRFPVPPLNEMPDDIRQKLQEVQQKSGFIPNVFLVFAHRPAEFRAFFAYYDALMSAERPGGLSLSEKEMIVVVTSAANQCQYCVIAHSAILRVYSKNEFVCEQLSSNYRKADISPRQKAILDFALKVSQASSTVSDEDISTVKAKANLTDEDVWDIGAIASFFALSNRMANLTNMRPNYQFQLIGRGKFAQSQASSSLQPE